MTRHFHTARTCLAAAGTAGITGVAGIVAPAAFLLPLMLLLLLLTGCGSKHADDSNPPAADPGSSQSQVQAPDPDTITPGTSAPDGTLPADPTATGNGLKTNEGVTIFGAPASSFPKVEHPTFTETANMMQPVATLQKMSPDGEFEKGLFLYGRVSATKQLAVQTPAPSELLESIGEDYAVSVPDRPGVITGNPLKSGKFTPFGSTARLVPGEGPRDTSGLVTDGTNAYWLESHASSWYFDDWRLFSANLTTGTPRLLLTAQSALGIDSHILEPNITNLQIQDGVLYFISSVPTHEYRAQVASGKIDPDDPDESGFRPALVSVNTKGKEFTVIAENVRDFALTPSGPVYFSSATVQATSLSEDGSLTSSPSNLATSLSATFSAHATIIATDAGRTDGTYSSESALSNLSAHGNTVVYTRGATLYILDMAQKSVQQVDLLTLLPQLASSASPQVVPLRVNETAVTDGVVALLLSTEPASVGRADSIVVYQIASATGTFLQQLDGPFNLQVDGSTFTFTMTGESGLTRYSVPATR